MLAGQENQENIPPGSKAPPAAAAGTRVALGLLRGAPQRAGIPLQAARSGGEGHGAVAVAGRLVGGQQAFAIHVDEPDGEQRRRRGSPASQKEEAALGLRAAVCALGERRPLAPLSNAMELSFGVPLPYACILIPKASSHCKS